MIMLVEIDDLKTPFGDFVDVLKNVGEENGLYIQTVHEDIFNSMHKI